MDGIMGNAQIGAVDLLLKPVEPSLAARVAARRMIALIARAAHEMNRAYCQSIGDDSQLAWTSAPTWQQGSAIKGVEAHLQDQGLTPEQSHRLWLDEKASTGWVYGAVKDEHLKTHPCIVPYEQLPLEQRVKDHLFAATVRQCLVFAAGMKNLTVTQE